MQGTIDWRLKMAGHFQYQPTLAGQFYEELVTNWGAYWSPPGRYGIGSGSSWGFANGNNNMETGSIGVGLGDIVTLDEDGSLYYRKNQISFDEALCLILSGSNSQVASTNDAQQIRAFFDHFKYSPNKGQLGYWSNTSEEGGSISQSESGNGFMGGIISEPTIITKWNPLTISKSLINELSDFWNSFSFKENLYLDVGIQIGADIKTPAGSLGLYGNELSRTIIGKQYEKSDGKTNSNNMLWRRQDGSFTLNQGVSLEFLGLSTLGWTRSQQVYNGDGGTIDGTLVDQYSIGYNAVETVQGKLPVFSYHFAFDAAFILGIHTNFDIIIK